jgi:hypothetical protein
MHHFLVASCNVCLLELVGQYLLPQVFYMACDMQKKKKKDLKKNQVGKL